MLATGRVDAGIAQPQPLYWLASHDVRIDDFIHVGQRHPAIPHPIGIDHQVRTVLALVQAPRLIRPYPAFQSAFRQFLLEQFLQLCSCRWVAASSRMSCRPLVPADENMLFKLGHGNNVQDGGILPGHRAKLFRALISTGVREKRMARTNWRLQ